MSSVGTPEFQGLYSQLQELLQSDTQLADIGDIGLHRRTESYTESLQHNENDMDLNMRQVPNIYRHIIWSILAIFPRALGVPHYRLK